MLDTQLADVVFHFVTPLESEQARLSRLCAYFSGEITAVEDLARDADV